MWKVLCVSKDYTQATVCMKIDDKSDIVKGFKLWDYQKVPINIHAYNS